MQASHHLARAALEHLDDGALRLAAELRPLDAHRDAVAVHDFSHLVCREVDGRGRVVGQQQSVAVALGLHRADQEARELLAQAILAATVDHELAAADQLFELAGCFRRGGRAQRGGDLLQPQRSAGTLQHAERTRRRHGAWGTGTRGRGHGAGSAGMFTLHRVPVGGGAGPPECVDSPRVRQ